MLALILVSAGCGTSTTTIERAQLTFPKPPRAAGAGAGAATRPEHTQCGARPKFRIFPDGRIQYDDARKSVWSICLEDLAVTQSNPNGEGALWSGFAKGLVIRITQEGGYIDEFRQSANLPLGAGTTISLPKTTVGAVKLEIFYDAPVTSEHLHAALDATEKDVAVLSLVRRATPGCDPSIVLNTALDKWKSYQFSTRTLLLNAVLPTESPNGGPKLIRVDASAGSFSTNLDLDDQAYLEVWAYNMTGDRSEDLVLIKGSQVVQTSSVGPLLLYGLGAGLGSPFTIAPSGSTSPTGTATATASNSAGGTPPVPPPAPTAIVLATRECFPPDLVATVRQRLQENIDTSAVASQSAKLTALVSFARVDGGYSYVAEVRDRALLTPQHPPDNASDSASADIVGPSAAIVGSEKFATHRHHRAASVAVEEAWNANGNFSVSGYGYVPVAQSGGDQLFQMQALDHPADRFTLSGLVITYPVGFFSDGNACLVRGWVFPCFSGVGLGFGPTILRGGSGELLKQWNLRGGWEFLPTILPDVLLTGGVSWRVVDAPVGASSLGSQISLPKPATAPTFATATKLDTVASFGLSIDLAVITDAVAAVSTAVAPAKAGGK